MTTLTDDGRTVHVTPSFEGEKEHEASPSCWCEPEVCYQLENPLRRVWLHRRVQ